MILSSLQRLKKIVTGVFVFGVADSCVENVKSQFSNM